MVCRYKQGKSREFTLTLLDYNMIVPAKLVLFVVWSMTLRMLFLLTPILLPLALASVNDCVNNHECNNCTVSVTCYTGTTTNPGGDECTGQCTVWDDGYTVGRLTTYLYMDQICYVYYGFLAYKKYMYIYREFADDMYMGRYWRRLRRRETCRRDCSELQVRIFGSVKQTCDTIATYNTTEFEVECLYECLDTQGCTSMAFYTNPSVCVLNRHCQSTTEENGAATFMTVTCIAAGKTTMVTQTALMTTASQPNTTLVGTVGPLTEAMEMTTSTVPKTTTDQFVVAINAQSGWITNISFATNDTNSDSLSKSTISDTTTETKLTSSISSSATALTATSSAAIITDSAIYNIFHGRDGIMTTSTHFSIMACNISHSARYKTPTYEQMRDWSFSGTSVVSLNPIITAEPISLKQPTGLHASVSRSSVTSEFSVSASVTLETSFTSTEFHSSNQTDGSQFSTTNMSVTMTDPQNSETSNDLQPSFPSPSATQMTYETTADPFNLQLIHGLKSTRYFSSVASVAPSSTADAFSVKQTNELQPSMGLAGAAALLSSRLSVISPTPLMIVDTFSSLQSKQLQTLASTSSEASMISNTTFDHISSRLLDWTFISSTTSEKYTPTTETLHSKSPNVTQPFTASLSETPITHVTMVAQTPNGMQSPISSCSVTSVNPITTVITDALNSFSPNLVQLSANKPPTNEPHGVFTAASGVGSQIVAKHEGSSYGTTKPPEKGLAPTDAVSLSLSADHTTVDNQMPVTPDIGNKHVIIDFFDKPVGKAVSFAGFAVLFILVFWLVWKRVSTKSEFLRRKKRNQIDVQPVKT